MVTGTSVASICSDVGAELSLALFIGFGHNKSNEGIVRKVNNATYTDLIQDYLAEQVPPVEIKEKKTTKKKKKAQTKASKSPSSVLPPVMPSKRMRSNTLHHSSSDMEYAVGSEMGNQKMPHRPPQQADAQVHGSGGDGSDSAQAKSSNDLCSDTSGEENNSNNNLNSSGGKMPSAFQSRQIGMPFGMATHQYPQQLQDFSIPNNTGGIEGAQNQQMMPTWQMMMMTGNYNQGIQPQYGMVPTPQGFKMVPLVPMMMPPGRGIVGTTSAQEGTTSSLKTAKTSTSDTTHVVNNSTQAGKSFPIKNI